MSKVTCEEFLIYYNAFLDGEIDLKTSSEMQAHADSCLSCGARYALMADFRFLLREQASRHRAPGTLREGVRLGVQQLSKGDMRRAWLRRSLAIAAISSFGLFLVFLLAVKSPFFLKPKLIPTLVQIHQYAEKEGARLDYSSSSPSILEELLRKRVNFPFIVPRTALEGFVLQGAKLISVSGMEGIAIVYETPGYKLSFLILHGKSKDLEGEKIKVVEGREFFHKSHGNHNLIFWRGKVNTYVAISGEPLNELLDYALWCAKQIAL